MIDQDYRVLQDEIQRLRDEQQRLRDEQERLRRAPQPAPSSNGQNSKPDPKNQGSGQKSNDEPKQDKKEEEDKQQPKPSLLQRAREYSATHPKTIVFGVIGAVVLVALVVLLVIYLDSYESTDDAQVDGHLASITSRVGGTVIGVYVENDQPVQAGQLLVELDPRDDQSALEQAQASRTQAVAQLRAENPNVPIIRTTNVSTIKTSQSDLEAAQASVSAAEQQYQAKLADLKQAVANNTKAQTDVARYQLLVQKAEISREQFDSIVANAQTGAAAVEAADASAKAAEKAIDQSRAQLVQAQTRLQQANENAPRDVEIGRQNVATRQANVEAAEAALNQAQLNISYLKIYAPVPGIADERTVEIGQRIQPGQQLMTVSETGDVWITANFKETQLKRMRPGQAVDIHVDAYGTTYHGYVEDLPGASGAITSLLPPENATGNFVKVVQRLPVRIRLNADQDLNHLLKLGMSVEPKVWLNSGPR